MELRHLRYFVAVAEEEHFGRAAQRLHVSQPPLSRQIQDLEQELGVTLLERGRWGARLTTAGQAFYEGAQKILQDVERLTRRTQRYHRGQEGALHIGYSQSASAFLIQVLSGFRKAHPDIRIYLQEQIAVEQAEALRTGDVQLTMGYHLPPLRHEDFQKISLHEDEVYWAIPTEKKQAVEEDIKCLTQLPLLFMPRRTAPTFHAQVLQTIAQYHIQPQEIRELRSVRSVLTLVGCGEGFGFVPASIASQGAKGVLFLEKPVIPWKIGTYAFWKKKTPVVRAFLEYIATEPDEGVENV